MPAVMRMSIGVAALVGAVSLTVAVPAHAQEGDCPSNTFCIWATEWRVGDPDMTWTPGMGKVQLDDSVYDNAHSWQNDTSETVCLFQHEGRQYVNPDSKQNLTSPEQQLVTHVGPTDPSTGFCA
jgi:peptidase inhibitor family I36